MVGDPSVGRILGIARRPRFFAKELSAIRRIITAPGQKLKTMPRFPVVGNRKGRILRNS